MESALLACLVVVSSACSSSSPAARAGNVLRIGVDLPLSGRETRAATPAVEGVRFFVQTHPTLDGFPVHLAVTDDAADPARGVSNVNRLLADPTVVAMIGPFDGAVARKEIPVANAASLAMISPATGNPCLTRDVYLPALLNPSRTAITCKEAGLPPASELRPSGTNNFFRLAATDELQGAAAADFAFDTLHVLRAAVISDHESYGQGLAAAFSARFGRRGGSVVARLDVAGTDVATFLARAKTEGAQAVYYGGATAAGCSIRAQMSSVFGAGEAAPFLGGDGVAHDPRCVLAAGANSAGIYATVPFPDADALPGAVATINAFRAAFGSTAAYGPYTMLAYDATAVVYAALDRAIRAGAGAPPDRADVLAQVARTSGLAGVTGSLGFDANGDTTNPVITVFEAPSGDERAPWKPAGTVDYGARLPY
ncbi:MAG TPA: branched-chain amino acid ABC transporter substrate-binding protein [Candidatus Dormibacteraeota bacterium]|nr:branched-chain amino acid ABC transporter substrate-binding protein [Candidatus Dormibacteraeota bacterium]